jgi:hypothetical protein
VLLAAALACFACSGPLLADANDPPCIAPSKWFPRTAPPQNSKPNPDLDCDFYSWAWEMFLYITQEEKIGGSPRFLGYTTPSQLFGKETDIRFSAPQGKMLMLAPRFGELKFPVNNGLFRQADTNGVLVDQNGRAVFYATHMNADFAKFVRTNQLTDLQKLHDLDPNAVFPKGSLELKSSWKIVQKGEDTSRFFTTDAMVPILSLSADGKVQVDTSKPPKKERVALLGIHVVGVVDGHPEFIWATFEHDQNSPNLPIDMKIDDAKPVDPNHTYTLYPKGALAKDSNISNRNAVTIDNEGTQTLKPKVNVVRQFKFGGEDEPASIIELNTSVHLKLPKELAVWRNYSFRGAVWLNDPATDFKVGQNFGQIDETKGILGGEKKLSNATMETFSQNTQNCFHCHTSEMLPDGSLGAKLINISHIMTNAFTAGQQAPAKP